MEREREKSNPVFFSLRSFSFLVLLYMKISYFSYSRYSKQSLSRKLASCRHFFTCHLNEILAVCVMLLSLSTNRRESLSLPCITENKCSIIAPTSRKKEDEDEEENTCISAQIDPPLIYFALRKGRERKRKMQGENIEKL